MVVSNIFYFHPYLGKWSNLTNIFQMSWNHQLVYQWSSFFCSYAALFQSARQFEIKAGFNSITWTWDVLRDLWVASQTARNNVFFSNTFNRIPKMTTSATKFVFNKNSSYQELFNTNDWQMIPCLLFQEVHTTENERLVHEKNHPAFRKIILQTSMTLGFTMLLFLCLDVSGS